MSKRCSNLISLSPLSLTFFLDKWETMDLTNKNERKMEMRMREGAREGENEGEINHVVAIIPKMPSIAFSTGLCE